MSPPTCDDRQETSRRLGLRRAPRNRQREMTPRPSFCCPQNGQLQRTTCSMAQHKKQVRASEHFLSMLNLCFCSTWSSFNAWRQAAATTHRGERGDRPKTCHKDERATSSMWRFWNPHSRVLQCDCRPGRLHIGGTFHRMFSLQQIAIHAATRRCSTSNQAPLADHAMTPPSVK